MWGLRASGGRYLQWLLGVIEGIKDNVNYRKASVALYFRGSLRYPWVGVVLAKDAFSSPPGPDENTHRGALPAQSRPFPYVK